jgi:hypothetical protein
VLLDDQQVCWRCDGLGDREDFARPMLGHNGKSSQIIAIYTCGFETTPGASHRISMMV